MYTCDISNVKYHKHRRGVDATAPLLKDGKVIGTVHDEAIAIVAKVSFLNEEDRKEFLDAAIMAGFDMPSETYSISEYARTILMAAESKFMEG